MATSHNSNCTTMNFLFDRTAPEQKLELLNALDPTKLEGSELCVLTHALESVSGEISLPKSMNVGNNWNAVIRSAELLDDSIELSFQITEAKKAVLKASAEDFFADGTFRYVIKKSETCSTNVYVLFEPHEKIEVLRALLIAFVLKRHSLN